MSRAIDLNKRRLADALTDAFINYQWGIERPMNIPPVDKETKVLHYLHDAQFHAKVSSIVSGVMHICNEHIENALREYHEEQLLNEVKP
jgi:hypothetical protein